MRGPHSLRSFNPTLVRLKEPTEESKMKQVTGFNPTLVRLKDCYFFHFTFLLICFNPTLVRLKAGFSRNAS